MILRLVDDPHVPALLSHGDGLFGGVFAVAGMAVIFREGLGAGVPLGSLRFAPRGRRVLRRDRDRVVKAFPRAPQSR